VERANSQSVVVLAWVLCAKLGHHAPALFTAIDGRGDWLVTTGTTHTIASTAWALAKLDHRASFSLSTSSTGATATTLSSSPPLINGATI
jgi:hypothetical protein